MSTVAYCTECNARVTLTPVGLCPNGHSRPALRDLRTLPDGPLPAEVSPPPRAHTEPRVSRGVTLIHAGLLVLLIILTVLATIALLVGGLLAFWSFPLPTDDLGALAIVVAQLASLLVISLALSLYLFAWICYRALHAGGTPRRKWVTVALVIVALALLAPSVSAALLLVTTPAD